MSNYDKPRLTATDLRPQAAGRWLDILQYVCPGMFDHAIRKLGTHVTCPFHGGTEDFRFIKVAKNGKGNTAETGVAMCSCGVYGDGFAVIQKATGMKFYEVLQEVDEYLNGKSGSRAPAPLVKPVRVEPVDDGKEAAKIVAKNAKMWASTKELSLSITPYYLERGIIPEALEGLQDVRTVDSLVYMSKEGDQLKRVGNFPAILAQMRAPTNEQVCIHRTWLSRDRKGKAPVSKAKKLTETTGAAGAAIRLHDAVGCEVLGLSEGIETGLSARSLAILGYWPELTKLPVWACYAERNIRNFEVPAELLPTLKKIVIFADHDKNGIGLSAALAFLARAAIDYPQVVVEIKVPPLVGDDWNDELVRCLKAVDTMAAAALERSCTAITAACQYIARSVVSHPDLILLLPLLHPDPEDWNTELVRCLSAVERIKTAINDRTLVAFAI